MVSGIEPKFQRLGVNVLFYALLFIVAGADPYLQLFLLMVAPGILAIILATLNVVGGFVVTDRMLEMFKRKKK